MLQPNDMLPRLGLPNHETDVWALTRWYFAIDARNEAHPITKAMADGLFADNFGITVDVPSRDKYGVLIAEVSLSAQGRLPTKVERIFLHSLPADENHAGQPAAVIGCGVAAGLRIALRRKLASRKAMTAGPSAKAAFEELERRISAGEYAGEIYRDSFGRMETAVRMFGGAQRRN